jgi:hypothetical protein
MDGTTIQIGSVAGMLTALGVFVKVVSDMINHKRIRSNCCGQKIETSIDIDNTTPPIAGGLKPADSLPK